MTAKRTLILITCTVFCILQIGPAVAQPANEPGRSTAPAAPSTSQPPGSTYPPNAYPPNAYPPNAYPPNAYPPNDAAIPERQQAAPDVQYSLHRFAFGVGLGLGGLGWGWERSECNGEACGTTTVGVRDYSSKVAGLIQAQAFYQPLELLRFGPAVRFNGSSRIRFEQGSAGGVTGLGSILSVDAALELTPRLTGRSWLLPRLESGLSVLFPSSTLTHRLESSRSACSQAGFSNCNSFDGPKYGLNLGVGAGILWAVSESAKLRFDCLLQYYSFGMFSADSEQGANYANRVSGMWFMAHAGVEF